MFATPSNAKPKESPKFGLCLQCCIKVNRRRSQANGTRQRRTLSSFRKEITCSQYRTNSTSRFREVGRNTRRSNQSLPSGETTLLNKNSNRRKAKATTIELSWRFLRACSRLATRSNSTLNPIRKILQRLVYNELLLNFCLQECRVAEK